MSDPLPGKLLRRLTYRPRRGPWPVKHVSEDGRLVHAMSVQGIYRLAESSAADFDAILAGPPSEHATRARPRPRAEVPVDAEPLF